MSIYGYNILQEYSGNDADNQNYANVLKELDEIAKYYVEVDKAIAENVNYIVDKMKSVKKSEDMKKILQDCYNHSDDTVKKMNEIYGKFSEAPTFRRFTALSKKFSVKYSNITMEEKKKWAKAFKEHHVAIVNIIVPFNKGWVNSVNEEIRRLDRIDYEYSGKFVNLINAWYQALYNYVGYTHNNILYVIRKLDTGFEDTFKYKMVQKLFKDRYKK